MPSGLWSIIFGELIAKINYWGLQSILVIFLIKSFGLHQNKSYEIFGILTTFGFLSSYFGGYLGDKMQDIGKLILLGISFAFIGNIILFFSHIRGFYLGLTFLIFGLGLISPNLDNILSEIYKKEGITSSIGFTLLHGATNAGGLLAPLMFGFIIWKFDYQYCFIFSSLLLIIYIALIFSNKEFWINNFKKKVPTNRVKHLLYIVPVLIYISFNDHLVFKVIFLLSIGYVVLNFVKNVKVSNSFIKQKLYFFALSACFVILFYSFELQFNSSIIIYATHHFRLQYFGIELPANVIAAIEPFFVAMMVIPVTKYLSKRKTKSYSTKKYLFIFGVALICCSLGFALLSLPKLFFSYSSTINIGWIILSAIFFAISDLILYPTTISILGDYVNTKIRGQMIGTFYVFLASSGYLSSLLAQYVSSPQRTMASAFLHFSILFLIFTIILFSIYTCLTLLGQKKRRIPK